MAPKTQFKATYDGRVLVPEEPLGLCAGDRVVLEVVVVPIPVPDDGRTIEERVAAYSALAGSLKTDIELPARAFDRDENMYP